MNGRLNFTQVLGNVSKTGKYYRCLQEIQSHARTRISGDRQELRLQYLPLLTEKLLEPFIKHGTGGVDNVIQVMDDYFVTKEDWDIIMELGVCKNGSETRAKGLPTAVKSGFTRKYNSLDHPVPYMKGGDSLSALPSKKAEVPDIEDVIEPEVEDNDVPEEDNKKNEENDADFSKDKYVKVGGSKGKGKAAAKPRAPAKGKAKAKAK
jgi:replication factor C subunit 1